MSDRAPPDMLEDPKMCQGATRCSQEDPDVPEIHPDMPGPLQTCHSTPQMCLGPPSDVPGHPQMCQRSPQMGLGSLPGMPEPPTCARAPPDVLMNPQMCLRSTHTSWRSPQMC